MPEPTPASWLVIERGWMVLSADGTEVGSVAEVLGDESHDIFDGLTVSTGLLSKTVYVPAERVGEIREGVVRLDLTADEVASLDPAG
jgi:uncharacterized protein YrrD